LGVKNRFSVFFNWLYNYITYDQNLRLIFKQFNKPKQQIDKIADKTTNRKVGELTS
jgi:NADH dehydrogenase